ncbi:MAG: ATPase [Candidatus Didemnitutus sp.]|nr:ATPase [Candidatus Didemnitutus sp.]
MVTNRLLLGIDGGGTHTRALLAAPDGTILGRGRAPGCNYHNVGLDAALRHMAAAAAGACAAARCPVEDIHTAFIGTAGVKAAEDIAALHDGNRRAGALPAPQVVFANDSENAHAAGLGGRPGVALIAGTGSIALGRDEHGRSFLCGGWGWLVDDGASGCWLGLQALHAVARAVDGRGPATHLREPLLAALGLKDPQTILRRIYTVDLGASDFALLAPLVFAAARQCDAVALEILRRGAERAAELAAGAQRGAALPCDCEVVLLGGVAQSGAPYQPMIEAAIRRHLPAARLVAPVLPAEFGALVRAREIAGAKPDAAFMAQLQASSATASSHA